MGLLDKASDTGAKNTEKKPVAKAIPKPAPQVIETPAAIVAKPAKAVKAKRVRAKPQGLPANLEIASPNSRRISWFVNFVVNLGPIFGFLFAVAILDAGTTIFALVALAALIFNLIVIPIMSGRTLGNFISRTKNVKSDGAKPNFLHALLVNSTGILALTGIVFLMIFAGSMFTEKGSAQIWASTWSILGLIFLVLYFVNASMKSGSELDQGLYDSMFGAFLVKHVPVEGEVSTGFIGKLESMSSYGDRYNKRQEEKLAKKAAKVLAESTENDSKSEEKVDVESDGDKEDKKKSAKKPGAKKSGSKKSE